MLEFRDLRSGIWVKILVVVFHRPEVHILHRQMFPFRVAGWQHLGVWPLVDQEFGLGGFGIRPNSEVGELELILALVAELVVDLPLKSTTASIGNPGCSLLDHKATTKP